MAARPNVVVFDVNETLSDMEPLRTRFVDIGAPGHL
nr:haloacid dehalogenase [Actinomycetota bacterium]